MSKEKTKQLHKDVAPFAKSDKKKSIMQIINTVPPFLILWFLGVPKFVGVDLVNTWICCDCSRICHSDIHHLP